MGRHAVAAEKPDPEDTSFMGNETMKPLTIAALVVLLFSMSVLAAEKAPSEKTLSEKGWIRLFDGKSLADWKASEHDDAFRVEDGAIVVNGPRAHLFYVGPVKDHDFKNFEFKADVMTTPGANSGIYFHTKSQPTGWPDYGYEVQVNATHGDPVKTGSLYDIKGITESPAKDNVWFTQHIIVQGKRIIVKVDGKTVMDFTEPEGFKPPANHPLRRLTSGTFAFQAHDPKSKVFFKNVMVKPLPE
jgi:hypothetical protein